MISQFFEPRSASQYWAARISLPAFSGPATTSATAIVETKDGFVFVDPTKFAADVGAESRSTTRWKSPNRLRCSLAGPVGDRRT